MKNITFNGINEIKENKEIEIINKQNNNIENIPNNVINFKREPNYKIEMENQNKLNNNIINIIKENKNGEKEKQ